MMNDEGSEKLLYQLSRGWFFGEICWSNGLPTGIYSQAIDEVKCVFLPLEKAQFLFDTNASFRTAVVRCLANKTFLLRTEVENLAFQPCKKRIQRLFLAAMDKDQTFDSHWHPLKIKYSHAILGSIIGASRVTISKAINEMQNDGFVRTVNRQIQINPDNAE